MSRDFVSVAGPFLIPSVVSSAPSPPGGTGFSKVCACGLLGAARVTTNSGQEREKVGAERSQGMVCVSFPQKLLGTLGAFPWDICRRDRLG